MAIKNPFGRGFKMVGPGKNLIALFGLLLSDKDTVFSIPFGGYEHVWPLERDPDIEESPFGRVLVANGFVWNPEYFNFGVRYKKLVSVGKKPRYVIHTYLLIAFGKLLDNILLVRTSEETFDILQNARIIDEVEKYNPTRFYALRYHDLPLDNPAWGGRMATHMVELMREQKELALKVKILLELKAQRHIKEASDPRKQIVFNGSKVPLYEEMKVKLDCSLSSFEAEVDYYALVDPNKEVSLVNIKNYSLPLAPCELKRIQKLGNGPLIRELNETKQHLQRISFFIRLITFALERRKSGVIPWEDKLVKSVKRGKHRIEIVEFPANSGILLAKITRCKVVKRPL